MKIESLPETFLEVVRNNNGLKVYLNNLERGRPATPRSWLYEGKSDTEVLDAWLTELEPLKTGSMEEQLVFQYETSFLEKFGPQGEVKPVRELMNLVTEGFSYAASPQPKIFRTPQWQEAKRLAVKTLFIDTGLYKRLRPRDYEHVIDDMRARDTLESNSGFPDFGRRKKPDIKARALRDIASGEYLGYPAILLFRNYNGKTRPVWMYPMATNIKEGSFTQPLKEALMDTKIEFFAPWRGYEHVLAHLSSSYADPKAILAASDFSHTDAHYTKWAMLECYDVIKYAFQERYWDELKQSMLHVVDIPLVVNSQEWITGGHGVSSGSNWTNDCETYLDYIAETYFTTLGLVAAPDTAIGDDISHRLDAYAADFAEEIAKLYQSMGFDVNAEKVTNERDWVKYLQRLTVRGWFSGRTMKNIFGEEVELLRGVYRTVKALNSSLNPERFHSPRKWSKDMFACRQFAILENCLDHPLFHPFVKFVCKGHPYLVPFAKKTNKQLDAIYRESRTIPGLNPTYNQEKRDKPLSSFASIAYARTL